MAMVEGGHEADLLGQSSMPLPKTSPLMSPMPATVNGSRLDVLAHLVEVALHALPRRRAP